MPGFDGHPKEATRAGDGLRAATPRGRRVRPYIPGVEAGYPHPCCGDQRPIGVRSWPADAAFHQFRARGGQAEQMGHPAAGPRACIRRRCQCSERTRRAGRRVGDAAIHL